MWIPRAWLETRVSVHSTCRISLDLIWPGDFDSIRVSLRENGQTFLAHSGTVSEDAGYTDNIVNECRYPCIRELSL